MTQHMKPTVTRDITPRSTADVQFDHSPLDVILIDGIEHGGTVILRPTLTVAIDRTTRTICGIGIAQFPMMALKNCISDMIRRAMESDK
jgi:hypothetical protein